VSAVLDRPASVKIDATAWGLARDFRRRVEVEDHAFLRITDALFRPIHARQAKHPERKIRAEQLAELARRWRVEPPKRFRVSFAASVRGPKGTISERRVIAEEMTEDAWNTPEPGLAIGDARIVADKDGARTTGGTICVFSLHAIARRLQRGIGTSDADLIADMIPVAVHRFADLPEDAPVTIATDRYGGGWRGRITMATNPGGAHGRLIVAVRTWLPE
jgi:hypothetical protein